MLFIVTYNSKKDKNIINTWSWLCLSVWGASLYSISFLILFVWGGSMYMHMCIWVPVYVFHVLEHRDQRWRWVTRLSPSFLEIVSLTEHGAHQWGQAGQPKSSGDLNSALRDCTPSTLPTVPSSQPLVQYLSGFHGALLSSAFNSHAVPVTWLKWSPGTKVARSLSCLGLFFLVAAMLF